MCDELNSYHNHIFCQLILRIYTFTRCLLRGNMQHRQGSAQPSTDSSLLLPRAFSYGCLSTSASFIEALSLLLLGTVAFYASEC